MAIFEMKSVSENCKLDGAAEDYRNARKVAQYRVSGNAVYFPAFPGTRYIPFGAVTRALSKNSSLPLTGCCGKALPVVKVRIFYDGEFYQEFVLENLKDANTILDCLESARPDIPMERETARYETF